MAEVVKLIDPDGGAGYDYLSLALWTAGEGGDVTGTTPVAEFTSSGGSADTSYVSLNTAFTNADAIIIRPASADQYATEAWNDSIYRVVTATGGSLIDADITVEGLQLNYTGSSGLSVYSTNYTVNINRCFIKHTGTGVANVSTFTLGTGCQLNMTNTILTNNSWEGQSVNGFSYGTAKARNFFNVTIRHTGGNINSSGFNFQYVNTTDNHVYNCAITGNYELTRGINLGSNTDEDYNAVTDSSIDGAHSLTGQTDADFDFTNTTLASLDLSFAATSVLKDAGYDLSATFTDSINGITRPQNGVFDLGAFEFEVASGIPVSASHASPIESLIGLKAGQSSVFENKSELVNAHLSLLESVRVINVLNASATESLLIEIQSQITLVESRQGLMAVSNAVTTVLESLLDVMRSEAVPFVVLAGMVRNDAGLLESVSQVVVSGSAAAEVAQQLSQSLQASAEALAMVSAVAGVPLESLGYGIAQTFEDLEMLLSGEQDLVMVLTDINEIH